MYCVFHHISSTFKGHQCAPTYVVASASASAASAASALLCLFVCLNVCLLHVLHDHVSCELTKLASDLRSVKIDDADLYKHSS